MIAAEKNRLREYYRQCRRDLFSEEKANSDAAITANFLNSELYRSCRKLFLYISLPAEVDTWEILHAALHDGKIVAAPVCEEDHRMTFYRVRGEEDLISGSYGIREPDVSRCAVEQPDDQSLCVVPGFSFTPSGFRLGYGGGYYDRWLAVFPGAAVGLCRKRWLAEDLPADSFDLPVQAVVTEDQILLSEKAI